MSPVSDDTRRGARAAATPASLASSAAASPVAPDATRGAPRVSLVVRSMGRDLLRQAVESVLAQDIPDVEAVVVNALGPGHPPLDPAWPPERVRFVDGGPRTRPVAANAGMAAARGAFVGLLDDDDFLEPEHCRVLAEALEAPGAPGVAYSRTRLLGEGDQPTGEFFLGFNRLRLCQHNPHPPQSVLFRRALWESGCRFDESLPVYEDWDLWLQLAQRTRFAPVNILTSNYRAAAGSSGAGLGHAERPENAAHLARLREKWRTMCERESARVQEAFDAAYDLVRAGQSARAEEALVALLAEYNEEPNALHLLGVVLLARGEVEGAGRFVQRAIALCPTAGAFYLTMGEIFTRRGDPRRAQAAYQEAAKVEPALAIEVARRTGTLNPPAATIRVT